MTARRAFSLIEVLMSVFILGIGVIAIASLLPAGIKQQQNSRDISAGPVVAQAAIGLLRSKFSPSDFGGDDFAASCNTLGAEGQPSCFGNSGLTANYFCNSTPGDFNWTRPARWAPSFLHPKGAVHPFVAPPPGLGGSDSMWLGEYVPTYSGATNSILDAEEPCFNRHLDSGVNFTSRLSSRNIPLNPNDWPCGIQPSSSIFDQTADPKILNWFITQEERQWPSDAVNPKYYWDCMFRKVNGVVEVAIFVYRILGDVPGGLVDADSDGFTYPGSRRPHGVWLGGDCEDAELPLDDHEHFLRSGQRVVRGLKNEDSPFDTEAPDYMNRQWQVPGQLILDEFGGIHRVIRGRSTASSDEVEFASPILTPLLEEIVPNPLAPNASDVIFQTRQTIRQIWFIPVLEKGGRRLEPVYITVETL
jgi:prepilin-type N-terminal cleavage/methylation domain-containing protein